MQNLLYRWLFSVLKIRFRRFVLRDSAVKTVFGRRCVEVFFYEGMDG